VRLAVVLLAVLLGVAVYEAVLALGWISIGDLPGQDAPGAGTVVAVAAVAMVGGALTLALAPRRLGLLLPLLSVAVVAARYFAFDPYYAPSLRRYSEGLVSAWWLVLLGTLALVVPLSRRLAPLGAIVMLFAAGTLLVEGTGH